MKRSLLIFFCFIYWFNLLAQNNENEKIIIIKGKVHKAEDSTALIANIVYEKLPYYDDMGIAASDENGEFELHLVKGKEYIININKSGYKKFEKSFEIDFGTILNLYVQEDLVDLIKLENLIFAPQSDRINESSFKELDDLADWMKKNPQVEIQLEGHTDFRGNFQANLELSKARVTAVKDYLIKNKVKKTRISTKAFGGTQPLSYEDSPESRASNRRVEVRILKR